METREITYIYGVSEKERSLSERLHEALQLGRARPTALASTVAESSEINTVEASLQRCFYSDREEMNRLADGPMAGRVVAVLSHAAQFARDALYNLDPLPSSHFFPAAESLDPEAACCLNVAAHFSPILNVAGAEARKLLSAWGLPLTLEAVITEVYLAACLNRALGRPVEFPEAQPSVIPTIFRTDVSWIRFNFEFLPVEPLDKFIARRDGFLNLVKQELLSLTPGTKPGRKRTKLERNVSWMYRTHVRSEDPKSIAADHIENGKEWDEDRWGDVRDGVDRVLALLGDEEARNRISRRRNVINSRSG